MLERNPKIRITISELKTENFFDQIDWDKLLKKEIKSPINPLEVVNRLEDDKDTKSEVKVEFEDTDYTKSNLGLNRYPNITFTAHNQ